MATPSLDDVMTSSDSGEYPSSSDDTGFSLSDLARSAVGSISEGLSKGVEGAITNLTKSSNTAPVPDLTAKAATPGSKFLSSKIGGVSLPIVLIGAGAALFLILRRR